MQLVLGLVCLSIPASAQTTIPSEFRGTEESIARGVLDANLVETNFRNHGEWARRDDLPWGIWPRGFGGKYVDGVGFFVAASVVGERAKWPEFFGGRPDTLINPVVLNYRDSGRRTGPDGDIWGWLPLDGFENPIRRNPVTGQDQPAIALSDDPTTWPASWPDRLNDTVDPGWPNKWNGQSGKGKLLADVESFYVMDDLSDREYHIDQASGLPFSGLGVFYPDPADSSMGGLGLQVEVRTLQYQDVDLQDVVFMIFRITNVGASSLTAIYPGLVVDFGIGQEETDENLAYDPSREVAYGWDSDGIGQRSTGALFAAGYTGFAMLEVTTDAGDGADNDLDGMSDESRFSGPGQMVVGRPQVEQLVDQLYDTALFEARFGPLDSLDAVRAEVWWTGDEDLDWHRYEDSNGNGKFDEGEPLNDDVGRDGLAPGDANYAGRDEGEGDGIPTPGEPDFDELDQAEAEPLPVSHADLSARPFYESENHLRDDSWLWDRITNVAYRPDGVISISDVEPFLLMTGGPTEIPSDRSVFFIAAWIFGEDEVGFMRNRRLAQDRYESDFMRPDEAVGIETEELSSHSRLIGNYPNPFATETVIEFEISEAGHATVEIVDVVGRRVAVVAEGVFQAGYNRVRFAPDNLPSGVYFCRLTSGQSALVRAMLYLRE